MFNNTTPTTAIDDDAEVTYTVKGGEQAELTAAEKAATADGEALDTALSSNKKFKYAESTATAEERDAALEKYAKSYVAYIDKESNSDDGLIDEDEFVEHEADGTNMSEVAARRAFKQFDLNNDGHLDWKEYAALLRTYDSNHDGVISTDEKRSANQSSASGITNALQADDEDKDRFRKLLERNYNKLFGDT